MTLLRTVIVAALILLAAPAGASAAPSWRLEQPAPPYGAPGQGPVGEPGDIQFLAPNFGLMLVDNPPGSLFASGLMVYDGVGWRQLSTVCGGPRRSARIALVSENEWWTVSRAVNTLDGRIPTDGSPTLCHFRGGAVVGSYATALSNTTNPWVSMNAGACNGAADCWFGGPVFDTPGLGTFLLHWDGANLSSQNHPRARALSDLETFGGSTWGATAVGTAFDGISQGLLGDDLAVPSGLDTLEGNGPQLLRRFQGGSVGVLDWPRISAVEDLVDLRVLDSRGAYLWIAGRDAQDSYVPDDEDGPRPARRPPFLARMRDGEPEPTTLTPGDDGLGVDDYVYDIAALPDGGAWAAIGERQPNARGDAEVVRLDGEGRVVERVELRRPDLPVGTAYRIDCTSADQCWMVTFNGWVYRLSEPGLQLPRHGASSIQRLITVRPRDERTPTIPPDTIVQDESNRYVAPPIEPPAPEQAAQAPERLPALLRVIGKPRVQKTKKGRRIRLRIQVRRRARVQLIGRRGGRTVAKSRRKTYKPGRYTIVMRAKTKRWPTSLRFDTTDLERPETAPDEDDTGAGSGDTIST